MWQQSYAVTPAMIPFDCRHDSHFFSCGVSHRIDEYGVQPLTSEGFFFDVHASIYVR